MRKSIRWSLAGFALQSTSIFFYNHTLGYKNDSIFFLFFFNCNAYCRGRWRGWPKSLSPVPTFLIHDLFFKISNGNINLSYKNNQQEGHWSSFDNSYHMLKTAQTIRELVGGTEENMQKRSKLWAKKLISFLPLFPGQNECLSLNADICVCSSSTSCRRSIFLCWHRGCYLSRGELWQASLNHSSHKTQLQIQD